mgnify:CR=1 FL=1
MTLRITAVDLQNEANSTVWLDLLDHYARDVKSGGFPATQETNFASAAFSSSTARSPPMRDSSALVKFVWIARWQIGWTGTVSRPFLALGTV